ncbi:UNVERIFIED_CONTAM: hypothetical protein NCL1_33855 [Trichonephila clavipes]
MKHKSFVMKSSTVTTALCGQAPIHMQSSHKDIRTVASLNSASCFNSSTVAHADRTEVFLHADYKGFGFNINAPSHPSDTLTNPPKILKRKP